MRTRAAAQTLGLIGLTMTLAGCGLFGVKGAGLDKPNPSSLDPHCTAPPKELPSACPLGGVGAETLTFNDSHLYAGSTVVIPGSTNFLNIKTTGGRVVAFQEQFHANPPLKDNEARLVADEEVPSDSKRLFVKRIGGSCEVVEYRSRILRKTFGKNQSAVLITLRSADPQVLDKTNVASATIELTSPHSSSAVTTC
jgi:hypothetical protein